VIKLSGDVHVDSLAGIPSKQITLSARYVAIMKSCSTMKALFLLLKIHLLITLAATTLYSESK
jgi:hypothetical protein